MERIFTELSNPVWWFSVVIAGIVINILSSYLRGALDNFFSRSSSWWRNRSEARKKAWEEQVNKIASSSWYREQAIADNLKMVLFAIFLLLLATIFILFVSVIFHYQFFEFEFKLYVIKLLLILSAILTAVSYIELILSFNLDSKLKEARKILQKQAIKEETDV